MSKIHKLIMFIGSKLDPQYQRNINTVRNGTSSVKRSLSELVTEQSKLKTKNTTVNKYEKTLNSLETLKITQSSYNSEIEKCKRVLNTTDKSSEAYTNAKEKLKLLESEQKKAIKQTQKLELRRDSLEAQLKSENISTRNLAKEKIRLRNEISKLNNQIRNNNNSTRNQNKEMERQIAINQKLSSSMKGLIAAGVGYFSVSKASEAIQKYSDYTETVNKMNVVFGDQLKGDASKWAEKYSNTLGFSVLKTKEAMGDIQNLFTGFGMQRDKSFDMSKDIISLANDLDSFNNLTSRGIDVQKTMMSALMGESQSAKTLGASILEPQMQIASMALGLGKYSNKMDEATKIQIRLKAIQMQSKDAIGDVERNLNTEVAKRRRNNAELENTQLLIGEKLMPVQMKWLDIQHKLIIGFQSSFKWLTSGSTSVKVMAGIVGAATIVYGTYQAVSLSVLAIEKSRTIWRNTKEIPSKFKNNLATLKETRQLILKKGAEVGTFAIEKSRTAWRIAKEIPSRIKNLLLSKSHIVSLGAEKIALLASSIATKSAAATQWLLNAAMTANPIGLIITGIAGLTAGFILAYKKSERFRAIIKGTWNIIKGFWKSLDNNPLTRIAKMVLIATNPILALIKAISTVKNLWNKFHSKKVKNQIETDNIINTKQIGLNNKNAYTFPNNNTNITENKFNNYSNYFTKDISQNNNSFNNKNINKLPKYAKGGLINNPQIALVGEGGDKEMIIPVNSSQRTKNLFIQTAKMLGFQSFNNNNNNSKYNTRNISNTSNSLTKNSIKNGSSIINKLPKYAKGGLINNPQIALVGEGGDKEMIIPINSSQRTKNLFIQTAKMLGFQSFNNNKNITDNNNSNSSIKNIFSNNNSHFSTKNIPQKMNNLINKNILKIDLPKVDLFGSINKLLNNSKENIINNNQTIKEQPLKIEISVSITGDVSEKKAKEIGRQVGEGFSEEYKKMKFHEGRLSLG